MKQWEMTDGEISRAYRLAKDPVMMVEILAGLNDVDRRTMKRKLRQLGLTVPTPDRESKAGSSWMREEDETLAKLMDAGYSPAAIAARLPGRSAKAVYNRWRRLQQLFLEERKAYDELTAEHHLSRPAE